MYIFRMDLYSCGTKGMPRATTQPLLARKAAGKRNNRWVCSEAEGEAALAGDPLSRRLVHCQEDSCWKCFLTQSCQTQH